VTAQAEAASSRHAIELAFLALLALLWGSSYFLVKVAVSEIPPVTLIAARVSGAAVFLCAAMVWRRQRFPRGIEIWTMLLVQAMFNSIAAWTVLAWGQQYIDSGLAAVLNSTSPIFVFFITLFITRDERVGVLRLLGAVLGVGAVLLIVGPNVLHGLVDQIVGAAAALLGAALYACGAIYGKRFARLDPMVTATGTMIWATVVLVPASLALESPLTLRPSAGAIAAVAVLAVLGTGVALLIYFRLVKTLGAMGVASQSYLRAGVGVLLGVVLLGESVSMPVGFGLAAAILGVALINHRPRPKPHAAARQVKGG
jgi:drug/metabolite transporter (DMT)-like permease